MVETKHELTPRERALKCAALALDKKAYEVRIYEISRISSIADYLVRTSGTSDKQVQAIAEAVKQGLKPFGRHLDIEGLQEGNWVIIDYGDIIFHVFHEDKRRYYNLDDLWSAAPAVPVPEEYQWEGRHE